MMAFADPQLVIPPLLTSNGRDAKAYDNVRVTALANETLAEDDAIEHRYEALGDIYNARLIQLYDVISLGFESTAEQLARAVSLESTVSSYLDLGTGTGLTAKACIQQLPGTGAETKVVIIDALELMLTEAKKKLESTPNVATYIGDITALPPAILQDIQNRWGFSTFSLVTAQRVLLNIKKDRRVEALRHWKSFLSQGGKLVVDISHPSRALSAIMITPMMAPGSRQSIQDSGHVWTMCCRLAEDHVWEECRSYARDLARDAGLIITNDMPRVLPEGEFNRDGRPAFESWCANTRAVTLNYPLTPSQLIWFSRRYSQDAIKYYQQNGCRAHCEIAGVVVVFEHPPASASLAPNSSVPGSQAHTKYEIDETLRGKDRKNAIKKAAKQKKKDAGKS